MSSLVIPANPGSGSGTGAAIQENKHFWTPTFAGVTALMTSYERINEGKTQESLAHSRAVVWVRSLYEILDTGATSNTIKEPRPFRLRTVLLSMQF